MNEQDNSNAYQSAKKNLYSTLIICLVIFVGFTIYTMVTGKSGGGLNIGETALTLTGSEESGFEAVIPYDKITSIECFTDKDYAYGEKLSGAESRSLICGVYKNDAYGEYDLYVRPKVNTYCVFRTEDSVLVMNVESTDTTEEFTRAMKELLVEEGYWTSEEGK